MRIKLVKERKGHRYGWFKAWAVSWATDAVIVSLGWAGTGAWVNTIGHSRVRYKWGVIERYRREYKTYETILFLGPFRASYLRQV